MANKQFCYIGNWGKDSTSIGYTVCEFAPETGIITPLETQFSGLSVGAHCVDNEKHLLYTADEKSEYPGMRHGGGGEIHCFSIDPEAGHLTLVNSKPSYGVMASYVARDLKGEFLVATNHGSRNYVTHIVRDEQGKYRQEVLHDDATVVLYRLNPDGSIGDACDVYFAQGTGPDPQQFMPHLHSVVFSPDGAFFLVCDKGGDQIFTFRIDRERGKMIPVTEPAFRSQPGSAPRYSSFHPTRPFVYANNEFKPYLNCLKYDRDGMLELIEEVPGYPWEVEGCEKGMQSALHISKDGKYLYSLVRNPDVISVYCINQETGELTPVQMIKTEASNLRGATLSPDGRFLLVAAIGSHQVLSFPIGEDGLLQNAVCIVEQPTPCCVAFYPA